MNGQPPSPGWSPTSQNYQKELYYRLGILHLDFNYKIKTWWPGDNCHGWSVTIIRMITQHPKNGHPPSKIYHKEVYYSLWIWHVDLTHKIKTRCQLPWMISYHHQDGTLPSKGWSFTIQNLPEGNVLQTWNLVHWLNSQN